ncbi:MAG: Pvc16 family protein [Acidimicrobiia bacterium]
MSDFSIVQAVSLELRRQIVSTLETTPDNDFGIDGTLERIALESPATTLGDSVLASLYLYHLSIDEHLRNQRLLPDTSADDLFRRPPLPLRLRYLFTPVDDDETTNHLLIGRVAQHFHDRPGFDSLSTEPLGDSFGGAPPRILVRLEMLEIDQLTQLWSALASTWRLTLPLLIETAAIDSAQPPRQVRRVTQSAAGYRLAPTRHP